MANTAMPTHQYAGRNPARQAIGLPGHCDHCARLGHVIAHPELGCSDVGCDVVHDEPADPATGRLFAEVIQWADDHGLAEKVQIGERGIAISQILTVTARIGRTGSEPRIDVELGDEWRAEFTRDVPAEILVATVAKALGMGG